MPQIKTRKLGNTGLEVTELGLGGGPLWRDPTVDPESPLQLVRRALELGITFIDTAPLYAGGRSQQVIGKALANSDVPHVLATKCGRWPWQDGPYRDLDAYKQQLEDSLRSLQRDSVDLLFVHEADWAVYWEEMPIPRQRCELALPDEFDYEAAPVTQFLVWAQEQGLVRHIGISGNNAHLLTKVLKEFPLRIEAVLVAFQYSLIWRNIKTELMPTAKEMGVGVILGSPLQQGKLAVLYPEWLESPPDWMDADTGRRFRQLYEIQQKTGMSLAELAIRYLLADPDFASVIPGSSNIQHLEENVAYVLSGPLSPEIYAQLDELGKIFPGLWGKDF